MSKLTEIERQKATKLLREKLLQYKNMLEFKTAVNEKTIRLRAEIYNLWYVLGEV